MSTDQATDTPPLVPAVAGPGVERVVRPADPERDPVEYAGWLADKICNGGDYAKEAATALQQQAAAIQRLREEVLLWKRRYEILRA